MPVTKHTPGPWSINYNCEYAKHGQISIETNDFFIALVDSGLIAQQANARLIAAAPELLEALREMVAGDAEAIAEAGALGVPFPDEMLTAYRRAVAAIYKATGGTPCQ